MNEFELRGELIDLESTITLFEFFLLLKIATDNQELGPHEPIWEALEDREAGEPHDLYVAPYLSELALMQLTQQRRLIRLELVTLDPQENVFRLTPKGHEAVNWWVGELEERGFKHELLAGD